MRKSTAIGEPGRGVLRRVDQQVGQDPAERLRVGSQQQVRVRDRDAVGAEEWSQVAHARRGHVGGAQHLGVQRDRSRTQPGMVEQVVHQDGQPPHVALHALDEVLAAGLVDDRDHLDEALDRVQRGAQVVGECGEERLPGELEASGLGQVSGQLGVADQLAALVAQRR